MFGDHAAFIIPSYIATALVIGALTGWIMVVHRQRKREIAELEAKGVRRGIKQRAATSEATNNE